MTSLFSPRCHQRGQRHIGERVGLVSGAGLWPPAPSQLFCRFTAKSFRLSVLARSGLHCNISSSFPAKNELQSGYGFRAGKRASNVLTCGPIYSSISGESWCGWGSEWRSGTPLCIISQLLSINARIELVKINWEIITLLLLESLFKSFGQSVCRFVRLSACPLHFNYRLAFAILANSSSCSGTEQTLHKLLGNGQ